MSERGEVKKVTVVVLLSCIVFFSFLGFVPRTITNDVFHFAGVWFVSGWLFKGAEWLYDRITK